MELKEELQTILKRLDHLEKPETSNELQQDLNLVAEALAVCEKILTYLAFHKSEQDDMVSYLFQYKQLMGLEKNLSDLRDPIAVSEREAVKVAVRQKAGHWWHFHE